MRKFISLIVPSLLALLLMMVACGPDKNRVRLVGKLSNIQQAEFYVYSECGAFEGVDTIKIMDGEFVYERELANPVLLTLLYPNFTRTYVVAEPGKTIKMSGDATKIGEAEVKGSKENELLTDFRDAQIGKPESNAKLAAAQFIRDHATTLAAVAVFERYFSSKEKPDARTALQLLDVLSKAQPKGDEVNYLNNFFRPIFQNGVGQKVPQFSVETTQGKRVTTADYAGRPLLIMALGTWQSETLSFYRQVMAKVKASALKPEVLLISLDVERDALKNLLLTDSVQAPIVCDRQAFESPIVTQLGLRYVPSCMLVSAKGIIMQRDVTKADDLNLNLMR